MKKSDSNNVSTQNNKLLTKVVERRNVLKWLGATGLGAIFARPVQGLLSVQKAGTIGVTTVSAAAATTAASQSSVNSLLSWASGTTDLISVDFPEDSIFESGNTCQIALTKETTLGPCYFEDDTGEDISLGLSGLPMQLCLRLVDSQCQPLENYTIEVWHCDIKGIYSGDTSESANADKFAGDFCTGRDSDAPTSTWYRGKLTTDSNGRVNFKTSFPGWYRGRTIHIHFAVTDPSSNSRGVVSQFCFTDELAKEICTTHELYSSRGEQDTTLAGGRDTVFPSHDHDTYLLSTQQNEDGTLLAFQTIQIA